MVVVDAAASVMVVQIDILITQYNGTTEVVGRAVKYFYS
jgi:hypothetical protein